LWELHLVIEFGETDHVAAAAATELAALEEHLLACSACAERAQAMADYIDAMRRAIVEGDHDL
jgi:predicted anti-sigma-YlaC factor YlaD